LVQYLKDRHGLSFKEACRIIGKTIERSRGRGRRPGWKPEKAVDPPALWQTKAQAFQIEAAAQLLTRETPGRAFLRDRGLNTGTITAAGLGWNIFDLYSDRETWGLDPSPGEAGKRKRLWIPAGLVIPAFVGSRVIRLRIRRPSGDPRYVIVAGSSTTPMIAGTATGNVVIVESELDAILLNQEAGNLALIVALGSVAKRPDLGLHAILKRAMIILNALDFDAAGAKESWNFWFKTYGVPVKRWPVPSGKDPGEAYKNGIDLREWIKAGLE